MKYQLRRIFVLAMTAVIIAGIITTTVTLRAPSGLQTLDGIQFEYFNEIIPPDKLIIIETIFTLECSACRQQLIALKDVDIEGVQVIAVNLGDSRRQVKQFASDNDLGYTIVIGAEDVIDREKIQAFPTTSLLIKNNGGWEKLGSKTGYISSDELLVLTTALLQEITK
jgi:hypothetical protein